MFYLYIIHTTIDVVKSLSLCCTLKRMKDGQTYAKNKNQLNWLKAAIPLSPGGINEEGGGKDGKKLQNGH